MPPTKISEAIITLNEEHNIADCIGSVRHLCDEIVVVDSGSTDRTAEIAANLGARVVIQAFLGDGGQKQFATDCCNNDWVFVIDADERLSNEQQFGDLLQHLDERCQYAVRRANHIMGERIRYGDSYPDYVVRLFHRKHSHFLIHEHTTLIGAKTVFTDVELTHFTHPSLIVMYRKMIHFAIYSANDRLKAGKKGSSGIPSAIWMFVKLYLLRRGFLDGWPGFHWATAASFRSFLKHELTKAADRKGEQSVE